MGRPEVRHGGRHHHGVARRGRLGDRHLQLRGGLHADDSGAGDVRQLDVGADQGDGRTSHGSGTSDRVALPAGRTVAQEADRVERLAGAAGGDDDVAAGQVVPGQAFAGGGRAVQRRAGDGGDLQWVRQPAGPAVGTREPSGIRLDDECAALAQGRDVGPGGRVLPHLGVHRGSEELTGRWR